MYAFAGQGSTNFAVHVLQNTAGYATAVAGRYVADANGTPRTGKETAGASLSAFVGIKY
jgi:hypothetical protein